MDYESIGLNSNLRKKTALTERREKPKTAIDFDSTYEVKTNKLDASKINLGEFIKRSAGGTALGTFSTSTALNITSQITYNKPHASVRTFGKPVVAIYQGAGTLGSNQIYPIRGGSVTLGRYDVVGGVNDYAYYDGTTDNWRAMIVDTNGTSTQVVTFAADWIFTDYRTQEVS